MITFSHVTKTFGSIAALNDVSFKVKAGEFLFVTGPSGSGKTTILRLLIRDLVPDKGKITVSGQQINQLKAKQIPQLRRHIGVVFQDFKLLQDRTVYENIAYALHIKNYKKTAIDRRVLEVAQLVGLKNSLSQFPKQMAGGELQRTCLARAIVGKPKILLADEPTGNLDPGTSWQIMQLIEKVNQMGTTVIMATHNTDIVNSMKRRVLYLHGGHLGQDKPEGLYEL